MKGVYYLTDEALHQELDELLDCVEQALAGGACMIQFRDKRSSTNFRLKAAHAIRESCQRWGRQCIINDDIELARAVDAHGVHLGKDDQSLELARTQLGSNAIIGISCYGDLARAREAQMRGASYVAFGSFFPSRTKPGAPAVPIGILTQAREQLSLPICAIGGILPDNARPLIEAGADMLAVIKAISSSPDPKSTTELFSQMFTSL